MPTTDAPSPRKPGRYQFGLGKLFLVTLLVAIAASAYGGLTRLAEEGWQSFHVLMAVALTVVAAPMAALIAVSLFHSVFSRMERRRKERDDE